jgi:hypothetical protein
MLLREDRLRLMGGKYNDRDTAEEDADDVLNDEYFKSNYKEDSDDDMESFMLG